jgi:RNA polymerase sigma factor (sigma-70 family)
MADGGTSAGRTRSVPEGELPAAEGSLGPNGLRAGDASTPAPPGAGASTSTGARLDRACRGDRSALGRLLEEQGSWLWGQARRLWPRRLDPKLSPSDLVQGVNQEAARSIGRCPSRNQSSFRAWLRTILVRIRDQALRHLTADKRDVDREEPLPGDSARGSELHQPQTPAEVRVPRDELIAGINRVLDFLEDRDQQLLRLHYVDGLTFEQVATRLGQNAAALRQRAHRLLERLRRGVPLVMWTDQRRWAPIRSQALGLWCLRTWSPARVARELDIPEAAVVAWIKTLPVELRDSPDPGDPL